MTALRKYARLEATGVWCPADGAQRRDVIVSIGNAMLVISDMADTPLAHWSLAAIERDGNGTPAIYFPGGSDGETLELGTDEREMIDAIETLRKAVARARPHPGRLRWLGAAVSVAAVAALAVFWAPTALVDHALRVVPDVNRQDIGAQLLDRVARVSGPACTTSETRTALRALAQRTGVARVLIVPEGVQMSFYLPGGTVLLNRSVVEDFEEPDVAAGYVLAEAVRSGEDAALRAILQSGGLRVTAALLTTGQIPSEALDAYVAANAFSERAWPATDALINAFETAEVRSTPFAFAEDISGETTLALIEADPMRGQAPAPIMRDADWLRLLAICDSSSP